MNQGLEEDISQEILLAFYRAMPRFRFKSKVSTYLYTICYRRIARAIKKLEKQPCVGTHDLEPPEREVQADPMEEMKRKLYEVVKALLHSKNQRERKDGKLFQAHYILEVPLDELLKENWWMSRNGLRKRLHRVKERIKRDLLENPENGPWIRNRSKNLMNY